MSLEINFELATKQSPDHLQRIDESNRIKYFGEIVSAGSALRLSLLGVDVSDIDRFKTHFNESFLGPASNRDTRIKILSEQESIFKTTSAGNNPGATESDTARHMRRLTLISKIVRENIAEGQVAVDAVDLFMGNLNLDLNSMNLVRTESEVLKPA